MIIYMMPAFPLLPTALLTSITGGNAERNEKTAIVVMIDH